MTQAGREQRVNAAASLLQCKPEEVQGRVRAMSLNERDALTTRIDGVFAWVAEYAAAEASIYVTNHGKPQP